MVRFKLHSLGYVQDINFYMNTFYGIIMSNKTFEKLIDYF